MLTTRMLWNLLISILLLLIGSNQDTFARTPNTVQENFSKLESKYGGRLGISVLNPANNHFIQYRSHEHFPMCSTSKIMPIALVLKHSMQNRKFLQTKIFYTEHDIVSHSPVTQHHINNGMTVEELCEAVMRKGDNTAVNLLIKELGGVEKINNFARSIGDNNFRLDRLETNLNTAIPGDLRDTSTPFSMQKTLYKLLTGDVLGAIQKEKFENLLKSNTTGTKRIRAGIPSNWIAGDRTGTCAFGTTNIIGVVWPPNHKPIFIAIYFTRNTKDVAPCEDIIASATQIIVKEFASLDSKL